jgi:transposase
MVLYEFLQNQMKMFCILLFFLGVDQNVIHEHYHEHIQILHKHFVHQVHEIGQSISQSKDMTIYSYNLYRVMNVVLGMSPSRIFC